MQRIAEDIFLRAEFHHRTQVHNADLIGNELDHAQIVGNEDVCQIPLPLELFQQIDDLGLNGNVQRRNRLIADDQLGVDRQCSCDANSLALTAGELVGIALIVIIPQTALIHQLQHIILHLVLRHDLMDLNGLAEDAAYRTSGGQRGIGVLENDLHLLADGPHLGRIIVGDILAIKDDLAGSGLVELQNGSAGGGLATAGFANDTQSLTGFQLKGDVIHRHQFLGNLAGNGLLHREALAQMAHFQHHVRIKRLFVILFDLGLPLFQVFLFQGRIVILGSIQNFFSHCLNPPRCKDGTPHSGWGLPGSYRGTRRSIWLCILRSAP